TKLTTSGVGYICVPTSIMVAKYGLEVGGVDMKQEAVDMLNDGEIHIEEPGLQAALEQVRATGKFKASTKAEEADPYIVAVPTPNKEDEFKSCDISIVMSDVESIVPLLKQADTVIVQ